MKKLSVSQALSRAKAYEKRGEFSAASGLYREVLAQFPNNVRAAKSLAAIGGRSTQSTVSQHDLNRLKALYEQKQNSELVAATKALLKKYPSSFTLWNILGAAHKDLEQPDEASLAFAEACRINPRSLDCQMNLADQLMEKNEYDRALNHYHAALEIQPNMAEIHHQIGSLHQKMYQYDKAANSYMRALKEDPRYDRASLSLARLHDEFQRHDLAVDILVELWNRGHRSVRFISELVASRIHIPGSDYEQELEKLLRSGQSLDVAEQEMVTFLQARLHGIAGRYQEEILTLKEANATILAKRSDDLRDELDRYTRAFETLAQLEPDSPPTTKSSASALLILGPSRSGKTTLESLTIQLEGVSGGYESSPFENALTDTVRELNLPPYWNLYDLPTQHLEKFRKFAATRISKIARPDTMITLTNPSLALNAAALATIVPGLRIIFVKRDINDLALRIFQTNYSTKNGYSYNLKTIKRHIEWYNDMMHAMKSKFPNIVRVVAYDDMLEDPDSTLNSVADFCGLPRHKEKIGVVPDDRGCAQPYLEFMDL